MSPPPVSQPFERALQHHQAGRLARDLPRLAELRRTLRARMEASVLMDAPRFARNIEAAYRAIWWHWCVETLR